MYNELSIRMKTFYEQIPKIKLIRRMPVIIRLDGKAFHTFTKGFKKPFDEILIKTMQETFSCVKCNYISNADLNSSINIKNRLVNEYLRNELEIYDKKEKMYKGKDIKNKSIYQKIYNSL